jgi:hypothetical protein
MADAIVILIVVNVMVIVIVIGAVQHDRRWLR